MWTSHIRLAVSIILSPLLFSGCALSPYQLDDPSQVLGHGPLASEVVRAIRCEVVTFLVENKLRSAYRTQQAALMALAKKNLDKEAYDEAVRQQKAYPFIPIDSSQFAAITVDLKNVDTLTLSLGYDWKKPSFDPKTLLLKSADSKDYHLGPSYGETNTFELIETLGLPQNADLGPATEFIPFGATSTSQPKPSGVFDPAKSTGAYFNQPNDDAQFFCFSPLKKLNPHTPLDVLNNIQSLVVGDSVGDQLSNFPRIHIGLSNLTLAKWLQNTAADIVLNQSTIYPTPENILSGQMEYAFTLDVKPSIDLKYTLIASLTNPLIPDISGGIEHSGQFALYLNTTYSLYAFGAKQGNSCNPDLPYAVAHKLNPFNSACKPPATITPK